MARADDFLDQLAVYLEANGVTTVKTAIQPSDPAICTTLLGLPGSTVQSNRDVAELQFPRFQAIIRNPDYDEASEQYRIVRELLHGMLGVNLPVGVNTSTTPYVRVMRCHADQEGGPIGDDEQGRYEFSINFTAEINYVNT